MLVSRAAVQPLQQQVSDLQATLSALEESMQQADTTINHLKSELQASTVREAQLQQGLDAERHRSNEFEEELRGEQQRSSGLKDTLSSSNQQITKQLEQAQTHLRDAEARLAEMENLNQTLQHNLDQAHEQLILANRDAAKSNSMLQQNMREVESLQSKVQLFDSSDQAIKQDLEEERLSVAALNSKLHNKEIERARAVDQYLQEKVALAKARGEVGALQARLNLLLRQVCSCDISITILVDVFKKKL